ncbi:hypothetical protein L6452_00723 [Arctium lappa]|uniref:Uncharacterized protein n=1 Tax=Arctium lappa TaxID=4217 RepID=A0ACB9FE67_ARCLA|nr:hypothetical protein L6452_00723 [Arctium lappa]
MASRHLHRNQPIPSPPVSVIPPPATATTIRFFVFIWIPPPPSDSCYCHLHLPATSITKEDDSIIRDEVFRSDMKLNRPTQLTLQQNSEVVDKLVQRSGDGESFNINPYFGYHIASCMVSQWVSHVVSQDALIK